jgi:hypothetical protein
MYFPLMKVVCDEKMIWCDSGVNLMAKALEISSNIIFISAIGRNFLI